MATAPTSSSNDTPNGTHAQEQNPASNALTEKLSSAELIQLENDYSAHNYHPLPVVFDRAEGVHVWDPEGNKYIDMLSAYSAVNQGHCHKEIVKALVDQAGKLTLSSRAFYNSVFPRFARQMKEVFGYERVLPMNTGAEAVETAIKIARKWGYESEMHTDGTKRKRAEPGKAIVLSAAGNFHGRTLGVISMSTDPESRGGFGPYLEGVGPTYKDKNGSVKDIRYGHIEDLKEAFDYYGENVVGFLVEPIQGEAGIVVPPEGYLKEVRKLCTERGALFICDEIQTGLGRTGQMLCCDHDKVRPDIVLLGKALSGGVYPVSAVLADSAVMDCIKAGQHGSTYGGNPLGCAVAMTALNVIRDENLAEKADKLGRIFRDRMNALKAKNRLIQEVRGKGLLNAVVIDEAASQKAHTAWQFCLLLKSKGVLAKPTHVNIVRFAPPLVITEDELEKAIKSIEQCFNELDNLDDIPGEVDSEKGFKDTISN